ncbi:MAG TPA: WYL domain-containing protein [Nitriliruptorales bacterium]|nr:WYL domain-containing protein [Nitriliruptorales bacterium]
MTAKVERLINLTVALLETRRPMTFAQIRRSVAGYGHDDHESARRMFERDKEDLRRLGVPIETRALDAFDVERGYRIDRAAYALPAVDLSAEEVAALAIALQVTGEESARLGLAKLATRAPDPPATPGGPPVRVEVAGERLDDVAEALVQHRALRFGYRTATGAWSTRTVDPYGAMQRRGVWYLVGRDHDRDAVRTFRLDRLTERPQPAGDAGAFEVPADVHLVSLVAGPAGEGLVAEVAVSPAVHWEAVRRGGCDVAVRDDGWRVLRFDDVDPDRYLPWVLGLGADAEVLSPLQLRAEAARRLRLLAEGPG